jgi:4-hydroxy-4-methyl-2-oxoglutarate aldolase
VTDAYAELARLGTATVYEALGRVGLVDVALTRIVPESRAAGPARTVRCGVGDNLMVHAALDRTQPGDVLVLTLPEPEPFALMGELLATQAKARGAAAVLVDAAVRDLDELVELGLPIWARWISIRGAAKETVGAIDEPVRVGSAVINPGDVVVLDADGAAVVPAARVDEAVAAARERAEREREKRAQLEAGALSYDLDGLRALVEREGS